jgi:gamma-butyrobetaine dioxygenase
MNGVPTDEKHTRLIGEKISHIHKTLYGEMFDVTAADNPVNLAYTNTELDFHMDLLYYDTKPGLQVLHCYRNDPVIEGGLSTLVDGLAVANEMRETHPKQFDILTKVPVTFDNIHFEREDPVYMSNRSSHIVLDKTGRVVALNWCVSYERPLLTSENELDDYYDAYYTFYNLLESHKLSHQLKPGQVLVFNNLRMLHGRTGVKTNGGQRHLKGFYLNMDEFMSKLNVLSKQLNKREPIKHPLNGVDYYH